MNYDKKMETIGYYMMYGLFETHVFDMKDIIRIIRKNKMFADGSKTIYLNDDISFIIIDGIYICAVYKDIGYSELHPLIISKDRTYVLTSHNSLCRDITESHTCRDSYLEHININEFDVDSYYNLNTKESVSNVKK